jgi:hypothetical protein
MLGQQVAGETEEQRKKRMAEIAAAQRSARPVRWR